MEIPVLVERTAESGYRISSTAPFPFAVEGATKEEAMAKVRELMEQRTAAGGEVTSLHIPNPPSGGPQGGYLRDDPLFDEWQKAIKEYRDKIDAEDDQP